MGPLIWLLNYIPKHPNEMVCFNASHMILTNNSDAPYLSDPKSSIWAGGHFFNKKKNYQPHPHPEWRYRLPL